MIHLEPHLEAVVHYCGNALYLRKSAYILNTPHGSTQAQQYDSIDESQTTGTNPQIEWSKLPADHPFCNEFCANPTASPLSIPIQLSRVYIPAHSSFLISDIREFRFESSQSRYKVVVVDPPWPNLSAARSSAYNTLDPYELFRIPLRDHLIPGAIVAVWVTHKEKYRTFVLEKLFSAWGVEFISEGRWMKVTTNGEPMFDAKLKNRKSYEVVLFGRRRFSDENLSEAAAFPEFLTFSSVPSSHHSQKPFLDTLLDPYLPSTEDGPQPMRLELFARMVRSGWHSWGNECLKFNDAAFLEERPEPERHKPA
ncbi:MT-A70-domain-containing protein [Chytriomyces cf. hyalinus JEL632]|nr:MT-A70-domain-containing protein [Chytriomyces cf. hyalinus JEL632]